MTDTEDIPPSGRHGPPASGAEKDIQERDSDRMAQLLRSALAEPPALTKSLLPSIQERIRLRTRGRYYRDRWSRSRNPISLVLIATLIILIMTAAVYLVLQPLVGEVENVRVPPAPTDPLETPTEAP